MTHPDDALSCSNLTKKFDSFTAVDDLSFTVEKGRFFSILGPSGCGKTTLLRMLAGFEHPTSGSITIKGQEMSNVPPNLRPVNMVFQHLALFPTMTVAQNIAYGLKRRGVNRADREKKVLEVLARVGLPDSGEKAISQLSGGQKQRIAIARCLVLEPEVLLLDEPLGALDLKLREHMKVELKQLQQEFGTTFVYITHDQSEALVMSDKVAVMNHGRFEQVGSPQELYRAPKTAFTARFVGDTNAFEGTVQSVEGDRAEIALANGLVVAARTESTVDLGKSVEVFIRPENIMLGEAAQSRENTMEAIVLQELFDGANSKVLVNCSGQQVQVHHSVSQASGLTPGNKLSLSWDWQHTLCLPKDGAS